jgi:putative DNA primase/helicase
MLDLETGELLAHSPAYRSTHQLTVDWVPDAEAPVFKEWLEGSAGAQADILLEAASAILDASSSPAKALFLFGPARSGKSTFLRLLEALLGPEFVAGVSLHQLSDDHFAAANLYGKRLNVDADVRAADVRDLSLFKRLTGEDVITANRKYGHQFEFRNRALFAFSANELPAVGENSRAYVARMVPVLFGRSFEGHEDPRWSPSSGPSCRVSRCGW